VFYPHPSGLGGGGKLGLSGGHHGERAEIFQHAGNFGGEFCGFGGKSSPPLTGLDKSLGVLLCEISIIIIMAQRFVTINTGSGRSDARERTT
jgi:hypothetical protein